MSDSSPPAALTELPFDQYQRYGALALAADRLRACLRRPLAILDVGDWDGLAARFCPQDSVIWLDPTGQGTGQYVQADGAHLPFGDASFDLVASLDTLEHVPREARPAVTAELLRVARSMVVVAVPCGDDGAARAEQALYDYIWDVLGGEQVQLREHREWGLPTRDELRACLSVSGWRCADVPSGLLIDWQTMMWTKHLLLRVADGEAAHRALDRRYNERHGAVDPALPAYRQIFFCARGAAGELPEEIVAALPPVRRQADADDVRVALGLLLASHARRAGGDVDLIGHLGADPTLVGLASRGLDRAMRSHLEEIQRLRSELVSERDRSAQLGELVEGYRRGRVMRALAALNEIRRRFGLWWM